MLPKMVIMIIIPKIDKIKPEIAKPLGALNKPIKENKKPKNQMIKPTKGAHDRITPKRANTNPAVPNPLDRLSFTITVVWLACWGCWEAYTGCASVRMELNRVDGIFTWATGTSSLPNGFPQVEQKDELDKILLPQ